MFNAINENHLRFLLLFLIFLLTNCCENSVQTEEKPYPEAEKQNLDVNLLKQAFAEAEEINDLQGLAIARNWVIVAEEYYNSAGPEPDPDLHVMSVTKSISSLLLGIAINKGFIQSVNQSVSEFLGPEVDTINPALSKVTIHHLLTMTCGHDWHELEGESEFMNFVTAYDQLSYVFNKPIVNKPGTVFNYSDGAAHLISAIITKATKIGTSAFADQYLFEPIGLGKRIWQTDNRNIAYGGVRLFIGIHDMIKIGYLLLNDGKFNGLQIVSADWISKSTNFHISTNNVIPFFTDYGYYWWLGNAHGHDFICATGYGGQFIFIVKELNLVVCSRTNYRNIEESKAQENWYNILNIIINRILPAVKE